jgi:hypothetical protein
MLLMLLLFFASLYSLLRLRHADVSAMLGMKPYVAMLIIDLEKRERLLTSP